MEKREPVTNFSTLPIISIKFTCHTLQLMGSWHCGCKLQRCEHSHWGQGKKSCFLFFFPPRSLALPRRLDQGLLYLQVPGGQSGEFSSLYTTRWYHLGHHDMPCNTTEVLTLRIFHGKLASSPSKQTFSINTRREVVLGPGQCCCLCQPCPSSFPMTTRREEEGRWFRGGKGAPTSREEPREHPPKAPQHRATGAGWAPGPNPASSFRVPFGQAHGWDTVARPSHPGETVLLQGWGPGQK